MPTKSVPMRTCILTRVSKPKRELIRLVRLPLSTNPLEFEVKVDIKGKERGRGASITADLDIFDKAIKGHVIEKSLKLGRSLRPEEIKKLRTDFEDSLAEKAFRHGNKPVVVKISKADLEKKLLAEV